MTYTGHVEPDGETIERVDGPLLVRKFSVERMDNNVYVIADRDKGQALVVDAAARPDRILAAVEDLEPLAVVQTHGHWDHVRAWERLADEGVPVWGHEDDLPLFPHEPDRTLRDGERLSVGDLQVDIIHTPGHTPGGLEFLVRSEDRPHLFSGDSLFPGGVGNTFGDPEKFRQLLQGVREKVFDQLPDDTWVYPGHGDDTTLGDERPSLPEWEKRGW